MKNKHSKKNNHTKKGSNEKIRKKNDYGKQSSDKKLHRNKHTRFDKESDDYKAPFQRNSFSEPLFERTRASKNSAATDNLKSSRTSSDHSKRTRTAAEQRGEKPYNDNDLGKDSKPGKRFDHTENKPKRSDRKNSENHTHERKEKQTNLSAKNYRKKENSKTSSKSRTTSSRVLKHSKLPKVFSHYNEDKQKDNTSQEKDSALIRLNRFISNSGVCSRREADELISQGLITVNGKTITELGYKVSYNDEVRYDGRLLNPEKKVYLLLNKPKDYITTTDDPKERKTVMQLVAGACKERIFPVGRLDRNTTGLLLFTNDGELSDKLTHPSNNIYKIYQVDLDTPLSQDDYEKIKNGKVYLEDGRVQVDDIEILNNSRKSIGLAIHEGRNRIVRRLFEHLGYQVVKLDRTMYAGLTKKNLPRGHWRFLTQKEINMLKSL